MARKTILVMAAALASAAFGADNQWQPYGGSYDGDYADPNHWSSGHVPAAGDIVHAFPGNGKTGCISYTNSVLTNLVSAFRLCAHSDGSADGVVTFDGTGGRYVMPDAEVETYGDEPFGFRWGTAHFFNLQTYSASGTPARHYHAVADMTNAVIRITDRKGNKGLHADFLQGYLNLYDPCGSAWSVMPYVMFPGSSMGGYPHVEVEFHAGSVTRLPELYCQGKAHTNTLSFTGGRHEILGKTWVPSNSQAFNNSPQGSLTEFNVTDGAEATFRGMTVGAAPKVNFGAPTNMHTHVNVTRGGIFDMNGAITFSDHADLDFRVYDGGIAKFRGSNTSSLGNALPSKARFEVSDAKLVLADAGTTLAIGSSIANCGDCPATCVMTNAVVENAGKFSLNSGTMDVQGGAWSNKTFNVGTSAGYPAQATFRDVAFDSWGPVTVERGGTLTVDGGTHRWYGSVYSGSANTAGDSAKLVITNNASILVQTPSGGTESFFRLGVNGGSHGIVAQYGGDVTVKPDGGIIVGFSGNGRYEMHGGTLHVYQIRTGYSGYGSLAESEDVIYQTGGLIDVSSTDYWHGLNVCDNASCRRGRVILDGGTLRCVAVRGWTGARAKGGTGWAVLEADGGTIEMPCGLTSYPAIENFDEAYVGANGLTFRSAYPVMFAQDFTDKAGAEGQGLLRLVGAGAKYATCTNSVQAKLAVEDAVLTFQPRGGVPAKMASAVTVTNEGGLSLLGDQTAITFKSLTMADRTKLQLDNGDLFRVTGQTELGLLRVKVTDGILPAGTYTVLVAEGTVSAATKANWARSMLMNGLAEGNVVDFSTEEVDGETFFRLTVGAGTPLSGDSTLRGATWDDAENWGSDGKPNGTRRAIINTESPATATVSTSAEVGAIRFNRAGGATLAGAGDLHVANSGYSSIESLQGANAIDVPLGWSGDLVFPISPGSSLTLGDAIDGKRLVKTLGGALYLTSAENRLDAGFSAEGGKLSFAGTGATGLADTGADAYFSAGTLEFTAPTVFTSPLHVSTLSATGAIAFKTDADVTLHDPVFEQGALVKRGSSALTLDFSKASTIAVGNGNSALGGSPSTTAFTFANDDPTSGGVVYTGLDVCEGDLVIRAPQGTSVVMPSAVRIGAATSAYDTERRAPPRLIVDGADFNTLANSRHMNMGGGLTAGNTFADAAELVLTNGAFLTADTFKIGQSSSRATVKNRVHVDGSTMYVSYELYSAQQTMDAAHVPEYLFTRGAELRATVAVIGPVKFVFDASDFYGNAKTGVSLGQLRVQWNTVVHANTYGDFHFVNGGRFYCKDVQTSVAAQRATRLHFDDGEWIPATSGDFAFAFSNVEVCVEQGGLKLNPGVGATWSLPLSVTGAVGRVVKGGAGTLALTGTDGAFAPGGTSAVESGTLKIQTGAVAEGVKFAVASGATVDLDASVQTIGLSGAGTVANGTLAAPVFGVAVADDGTADALLTLGSDVAVTGEARVDLGRGLDRPLTTHQAFPVLQYAGTAPDVSGWKLKNAGTRNARGTFTAANGLVNVEVRITGMTLIFR